MAAIADLGILVTLILELETRADEAGVGAFAQRAEAGDFAALDRLHDGNQPSIQRRAGCVLDDSHAN